MDKAKLKVKLKQIKRRTKNWWSNHTQSELDQMADKFDILVRELQEKYGYTRRQAVQEVSQRVIDTRAVLKNRRSRSPYE